MRDIINLYMGICGKTPYMQPDILSEEWYLLTQKKIMTAYLTAAAVAGIGLAVWRIAIMLRYYDPYNGEFSHSAGAELRTFGYVALGLVLLMATSYFFIRKSEFVPFSASSNQFSVFSSSLYGFVFAAVGIMLVIYYAKILFGAQSGTFFRVIQILSFLLLFVSAAYFIFSASVGRSESPAKKALSFCPALWALCYLVTSYINPDYNFNDPNRVLCNVSLAALALFLLYETRNTVARPQNPARFAISLVAAVCVLAYILPLFCLTAFWEVPMAPSTLFEAVECGAVFYIFAVLYTMTVSVKKAETAATEELPAEPTEGPLPNATEE